MPIDLTLSDDDGFVKSVSNLSGDVGVGMLMVDRGSKNKIFVCGAEKTKLIFVRVNIEMDF